MFENFLEGESKSSVFQSKGMVYWDVCFWVITLVLALGRWQWQWQFSLPPKFLHISEESKKDRSLTQTTTKIKPGQGTHMILKVQGRGDKPLTETHVASAFVWDEGESRSQVILTTLRSEEPPNHQQVLAAKCDGQCVLVVAPGTDSVGSDSQARPSSPAIQGAGVFRALQTLKTAYRKALLGQSPTLRKNF